jgi:flagellar motor switch protein FliN/FliY
VKNSRAEIQNWLLQEFSTHLATVLETMAGERPAVVCEALSSAPAEAGLCWRQPFSGVCGAAWLIAAEPDWSILAGLARAAAGVAEGDPASLKSRYLEMIGQALSGVAQAMSSRAGHEITLSGGEEAAGPAGDTLWATVHLKPSNGAATVMAGFDTALLEGVAAAKLEEPEAESSPRLLAPAAAVETARGFENSKTFGLLLDVELPVSVSFGRAHVPLRDVLKLTTGSIIELNRSISEPVEVIVNNCVIARGEVVVIEGNFGVRIQQVISREGRLRTLN